MILDLASNAPADFFKSPLIGHYSGFTFLDVWDRLLRISLKNAVGQLGNFSVDPETWTVAGTDFSAERGPMGRFYFGPEPGKVHRVNRFSDLAKAEAWANTPADLVVPSFADAATRVEKVNAKAVSYQQSPLTRMFYLTVISNPRSGYTHIARGYQEFYIASEADLWSCSVDRDLVLAKSYFKIRAAPGNEARAIARFLSEVDEDAVCRADEKAVRISLRPGLPDKFFQLNSDPGSSGGADQTVTAIDVTDGILRLDLLSDGATYKATFWIDLNAEKLMRTVLDGKEVFRAK